MTSRGALWGSSQDQISEWGHTHKYLPFIVFPSHLKEGLDPDVDSGQFLQVFCMLQAGGEIGSLPDCHSSLQRTRWLLVIFGNSFELLYVNRVKQAHKNKTMQMNRGKLTGARDIRVCRLKACCLCLRVLSLAPRVWRLFGLVLHIRIHLHSAKRRAETQSSLFLYWLCLSCVQC